MLRWQHKWGASLKGWQKIYDEGGEPPGTFYEQPEIWPHLQGVLAAFFELNTERQIGMGLGPIPQSTMKAYVREELELDGEDADRCIALLRKMDEDYLVMSNSSKSDKDDSREVKADDVQGVKQLFQNIGARQKSDRVKPARKKS